MKLIRVAAAALNQTPLDWRGNAENIRRVIQSAREQGVAVLCLPELCISGYGCEDAFLSPGVKDMALRVLGELVPHSEGLAVAVGLPILHRGALFNAACLLVDGKIAGLTCKQNLAGEGIHYEPRWFKPWPQDAIEEIEIEGKSYPIGSLRYDCGGVSIGFEICEDAWVARRPGSRLALEGVDVILNPSASHFAFDKQEVRRRFVLEGSRAFGVSYVYANLLGNEAGRAIYDGGTMIAASGRMLAEGPRFSFADFRLTSAVIDVDETRMSRARIGSFQPLAPTSSTSLVRCPIELPRAALETPSLDRAAWETGEAIKEEEFARAVALGMFDYLRKSHSRGFVVSLSGGADSSAVATLAWLAVILGDAELGPAEFARKLAHIEGFDQLASNAARVGRLLTCVYQATRNSSQTTRDAARGVAEALSATFLELDVDAAVQGYVSLIGEATGWQPDWNRDDLALQNIQARARAPSVWLLANLRGALLLSTSNRSEAAVGYATMDGDTCGGLSPIAGIDKAFLRHWLRWIETRGPDCPGEQTNVPALRAVNEQQPTAELRPQEASQTDEDDLMPYEVLDAIEKAAIRDKHPPVDVMRKIELRFPQYDRALLGLWVERFFRLWTRNQWKRERYAPSFHLDDENLDPKTWCRFPILSGGFEVELADLRAELERDS